MCRFFACLFSLNWSIVDLHCCLTYRCIVVHFFYHNAIAHLIGYSVSVHITFICIRKPKNSCDSLHCGGLELNPHVSPRCVYTYSVPPSCPGSPFLVWGCGGGSGKPALTQTSAWRSFHASERGGFWTAEARKRLPLSLPSSVTALGPPGSGQEPREENK